MSDKKNVSRRQFFKAGLGVAGGLVASPAVANVCSSVQTGAQGLGPFFPRPGTPEDPVNETNDPQVPIFLSNDNDLTVIKGRPGRAKGQEVIVRGVVQDVKCQPVAGATVIIWQASESGRYNHKGDDANQSFKDPRTGKVIERELDPYFQSWGQTVTNDQGEYEFKTIVPGFYPADVQNKWYRPPHIHFMVTATGFPQFVTQMYFKGEKIKDNAFVQELNDADFLLQNQSLTAQQKEDLVVDFKEVMQGAPLEGQFNLTLNRNS